MNLKAEITVDELLKAMKLCACVPECSWCAYYDPKKLHKDKCYERRNRDFEYYISNLQDTNEALINGQETLQKALAERLAEVDDLKKRLATLDLCEKSNDELRSALKKKDDELKAVTKRAAMWHRETELNAGKLIKMQAEVEKLNRENNVLIKSFCNKDPLQWCGKMCGVAMGFADTAMDSAMDEIIQIMTDRILSYKTGIYINGEELIIIPMSDYNEILKELEDDAE